MIASSDEIIWQGNSWQLLTSNRTLASGESATTAYINHPGSVVLVPWQESADGPEVLMLRQYRHALRDWIFELPAGTKGWNEDFESCAQRELREETGFRAGRLSSLGRLWPAPGITNEEMEVFLAADLVADPLPQDFDEEIEVVPLPLLELIKAALDGRMVDAKSALGILRAAAYLRLAPFNS